MNDVSFSSTARRDLGQIWAYIAADDSDAATETVQRIVDRCDAYGRQPEMGTVREDIGGDVRCFSVGRYVVYYRIEDVGIGISRVLHSARDVDGLI